MIQKVKTSDSSAGTDAVLSSCCYVLVFLAILFLATPAGSLPPDQPVRMIAEWEPALGTLIVWPLGIPSDLVVELARDDTLYTLVQSTSSENQARNSFQSWGIDLDRVVFIQAWLNSMWTRDWGPLMVFDGNGEVGITDPWFDGYPSVDGCTGGGAALTGGTRGEYRSGPLGYDDDDAINATLAAFFGWRLHEIPAYCTGGNIMTDGFGLAMSTQLMLMENAPHMSESQFRERVGDYLGIETYGFFVNPEVYGIQHIDCYAKLLDPETILIKQLPTWHPEYPCVEDLVYEVATLSTCYGRPYKIVRVFCDVYSGNAAAAYTNSLILNGKVLVPLFGIPSDDDALQTYTDAMPGYEVIGFEYGGWHYYDALHCRTMGIFDPGMLRVTHRPLDECAYYQGHYQIAAIVDDRSETGLVSDQLRVLWQLEGDAGWQSVPLVATVADSFEAWLPGQMPGSRVNYYLVAEDYSGRRETLPRTAPAGHFTFEVDATTAAGPPAASEILAISSFPNPSPGAVTFRLTVPSARPATLEVFDVKGRRVRTLLRGEAVDSGRVVVWDGCNERGVDCPSGVYLLSLRQAGERCSQRCVLVR